MRGVADCRGCEHFIPYDALVDPEHPIHSEVYVPLRVIDDLIEKKEWLGEDVKGYCLARKKPVTYYRGHCRHYEPKRKQLKQLTLTGGVAWIE